MVSTFIICQAPLNDSLNCLRLTLLTAASGSTTGGVEKSLESQEEPFGAARISRGVPGMAVLPPNLSGRDEQLEVGYRGEQSMLEGQLIAGWMRWAAMSCLPEDGSAGTKGAKSFPPFHMRRAAGAGPSSVCSSSPSLFSLPYLTCRNQEIKTDGEQTALARSSLLKRVIAGQQLPNVKKLSGYRSDWG